MDPLVAAGATPFDRSNRWWRAWTRWSRCSGTTRSHAKSLSAGSFRPRAKASSSSNRPRSPRRCMTSLADAAARRGVDFLACPVIGSVDGARTGALTLYPGGSTQAFERGRELLSAMGSTVKFTGSPAASGHLKLASNCVLAVIADSLGELLGILGRAGVDRALAVDTLVYMLERVATKRQQLQENDAQPRFSASALLKDLRLARAAREASERGRAVDGLRARRVRKCGCDGGCGRRRLYRCGPGAGAIGFLRQQGGRGCGLRRRRRRDFGVRRPRGRSSAVGFRQPELHGAHARRARRRRPRRGATFAGVS